MHPLRLLPVAMPLWVVLSACSSDPIPPTLSILSQTPASLALGVDEEDDVSLRLGYEDGDGDLGGGVVHVHDCRDAAGKIELPIPVVASPEVVENEQSITGELIALIPDIAAASTDAAPSPFCTDLGVTVSAGELVFCVSLEDSAGGASDGACSEPFVLVGP